MFFRHRGFSQVEVLVVMAIILLILGFLLPSACLLVRAVKSLGLPHH